METITDMDLFKLLLHDVEEEYAQSVDYSLDEIKEWKGQEIIHFQDHLRSKTGNTVSEKWFYTYVKNESEKLPRIDILNILTAYTGHTSWNNFIHVNKARRVAAQQHNEQLDKKKSKKENRSFLMQTIIGVVATACIIAGYNWWQSTQAAGFSICFHDQDRRSAITDLSIDIILFDGDQKSYHKTDSLGCFQGKSNSRNISLIAQSPYHKNDTIHINLDKRVSNLQYLKTDDYALMLDYYSNNKVAEYKNRRAQLDKLIDHDAILMEVLPHSIGVTLYDKADFINKLTTPTSSLKRLEIIETNYKNEKITKLKFRIQR